VPAVVAYNQFTARCRDFAARMDDFSRELLNSMEEVALKPGQDPAEREAARGLHQ
jgi:biopolymer transport protein TolQ